MEDPKVLFADTTARRAQLMAATERFKASISDNVEAIKGDANEVGKTVAFVAGVSFAVYLVANVILPKSPEYRYAEKYGEPDDRTYGPDDLGSYEAVGRQQKKEIRKSAASSGLIGGLITSVLTAVARQQLAGFLERIRQNNAINPAASPTSGHQYHEKATTDPA
ncbi:MAG: hypothetical protein H7Z72_00985 [Bacteroidetes bacterium]|nr:hypothetical protein [Fibrella sp.]